LNKDTESSRPSIDEIFNPASVAIVGLPRGMKAGKIFLIALLDQKYPGRIYPVHPTAKEIDGIKAFPSVSAIPDPVDLAIILVPHQHALSVVRECAQKGVKGAVLFTAGYGETGNPEGKRLEKELVRITRKAGMRLFGPNCMGIYSPRAGLSFFPELPRRAGPVGFISHSGSLANILGRIASQKGIFFSKAVSLGNECDLNSADMLHYLGDDPETTVIGAYLEGIKDGPAFLTALKRASLRKPVILWKVGLSAEGSRAAASHTGALAGSRTIWETVVRQGGGIPVTGFEPLVDALMGFSLLPSVIGDRVAIVSGPGGLAVAAAEACGNMGLKLAALSPKTRSALHQFVPPTGTSLANPVDVGLTASLEINIYIDAVRALALDPGVDAIVVVGAALSSELNERYTELLIQTAQEMQKPLLMVNIPGFDQVLAQRFCQAGIPFFETVERAFTVYHQIMTYLRWVTRHTN
jgi:acetyltransferase